MEQRIREGAAQLMEDGGLGILKILSSGAAFSLFFAVTFWRWFQPVVTAFSATQGAIAINEKILYLSIEFPLFWTLVVHSFPVFLAGTGGIVGWYLYQMLFADLLQREVHYEIQKEDVVLPPFPWQQDRLQLIIGLQHEQYSLDLIRKPRYILIDEKAMFQNILVTGTIGTGKTTSVMYPLLKQAMFYQADHPDEKAGMLVLDVKGNFYEQVLQYARECGREGDIILIQLDGAYCYNPVHKPEMEAVDLAERCRLILDLFNSSGAKKDAFWDTKAAQMLTECIRLLRNTIGYVTLEKVHDLITDKKYLRTALLLFELRRDLTIAKEIVETGDEAKMSKWLETKKGDGSTEEIVPRVLDMMIALARQATQLTIAMGERNPIPYDPEDKAYWQDEEQDIISPAVQEALLYYIDETTVSHFDYSKCSAFFTGEFASKAENTLETIKAVLTQITAFFASSEKITRTFCAPLEELNFSGFDEAINKGMIVVLAMNIAEHPQVSRTIAAYLKLDFQAEIQQRTSPHRGLNRTRPMFFVCDEYQEFVTENDSSFYGISREARCCTMVATQSYASLLKSVHGHRPTFDTLIQNMVNKIALRSDDRLTIETMQLLTGKVERTKTSTSISESAANSKKSGLFGGLIAHKASISESLNTSIQKEALFDERAFTQVLKQHKAIVYLADEQGMQEPMMLHLLPYYQEPVKSLGGTTP